MRIVLEIVVVGFVLAQVIGCASGGEKTVGTGKTFKGPVGLQLYSLRDMMKEKGPAATLDQTRAFGFKYVEVADLGGLSAADFKKELDKRGLVPVGRHYPYEQLRDDISAVIADAKALGLPYAGCAWITHEGAFTEKMARDAADVFNKAGAALAKEGIKFYYHNHGYEFQPHGNGTLFDLLAAQTDPKNVYFQMDVVWTIHPGQDPVKLLEKYGSRWLTVHLKDLKKGVKGDMSGHTELTNNVPLGSGQVDWPAFFKASQKIGVKYYIIEDEAPTVVQQIPVSLRYLESL
jgi:sugar phosphate isomerase/epimerase